MLYVAIRPNEHEYDRVYWSELEAPCNEFVWDSFGLCTYYYQGTLQQFEIDHPDILAEFDNF